MTTTAVIVLGILAWVGVAIPLALFVARVNRLNRSPAPVVEPRLEPAGTKPIFDPAAETPPVLHPTVEVIARFPEQPRRFVGRAEVMAAAATALAPDSGRTTVVFHGMAGAGKTTCAVELAYRHKRDFLALAFWSAPTDPNQFSDALRLLAMTLDAQVGSAIVEEIATQERLENFLPTLRSVVANANLLLVLDHLDSLLTPEGHWRDPRWLPLIDALTDHQGPSRVILTSRIVPAGLNPDRVSIHPVPALSQKETVWLMRRLPHLRAVLHTPVLGRAVLTLSQGHPLLLEFADAAAVDPPRLAYQLAEIEAAVNETALAGFLTEGHTTLGPNQLLRIVTIWTITVAATLPTPARLLLHALCRLEKTDRNTGIIGGNWTALWQHWGQPSKPPPPASPIASLVDAALITEDSPESTDTVDYRIHPSVVEAIHSITPEPVAAAVDAQLAAWWSAVAEGWVIEPTHASEDTGPVMVRAGLAAARYLLRQHDWHAASCMLEGVLIRQGYSPLTCLAVIPLLRRIAQATGAGKDLVVLGAALRKLDPAEAQLLLRHAYHHATTEGDAALASTTAGELITLLRDQNKLPEALALAEEKIEHTRQAGFGVWTHLSDHGRRLQILHLLGHHQQVLSDLPALRTQMAQLPDHPASNDRVNPENAQQGILDIGHLSAMALHRWDEALKLNDEITSTQRRSGASPQDIARTRFNDYIPLLHLGRLADADQLLHDCQQAFHAAGDIAQLAIIYAARAELADKRNRPGEAVDLQRISLRLRYIHPDPHEISTAHQHLAKYLSRTASHIEQYAHLLTAALLNHLTGNTRELTETLTRLRHALRSNTNGPDTPALPRTLPDITRLVDTDNGVHFARLVSALCPATTAEHALTHLLTITVTATDQTPLETNEPPTTPDHG